jgi:hypothetical protein
MKQNKEVLVAIKMKKTNKVFSFKTRKNALSFIRDLKKLDKNINYAITIN